MTAERGDLNTGTLVVCALKARSEEVNGSKTAFRWQLPDDIAKIIFCLGNKFEGTNYFFDFPIDD